VIIYSPVLTVVRTVNLEYNGIPLWQNKHCLNIEITLFIEDGDCNTDRNIDTSQVTWSCIQSHLLPQLSWQETIPRMERMEGNTARKDESQDYMISHPRRWQFLYSQLLGRQISHKVEYNCRVTYDTMNSFLIACFISVFMKANLFSAWHTDPRFC
jgi:hypothetical protein